MSEKHNPIQALKLPKDIDKMDPSQIRDLARQLAAKLHAERGTDSSGS